jgi:DNA-binding response OmpR family regulator
MAHKPTILIIDDEPSIRQPLIEAFTKENFTILEAPDGASGLELAKVNHPDILLLDLVMPVMDGMTMLKQLRQDAWGKDARVIILTNDDTLEPMADALGQKAYDYLIKSNWQMSAVVAKVKQRLAL